MKKVSLSRKGDEFTELREKARKLFAAGASRAYVSKLLGVTTSTSHKWHRDLGFTGVPCLEASAMPRIEAPAVRQIEVTAQRAAQVRAEVISLLRAGVTQAEISRRLGIAYSTIHDWKIAEFGKNRIQVTGQFEASEGKSLDLQRLTDAISSGSRAPTPPLLHHPTPQASPETPEFSSPPPAVEEPPSPIPPGAVRHPDVLPNGHIRRENAEGRRFVITAAQNATPVHRGFMASLEHYCREHDATLLVIPYRYKNPNSLHSSGDDEWWHASIARYLCAERVMLNQNLVVLGDIKIQATSTQPINGLTTETGLQSAILGHPRRALRTVAMPQGKYPKQVFTTGAITTENYTDTKLGKRGHSGHCIGAVVVEVGPRTFHHRQLTACEDGSFIDLRHEYTPDGVREAGPALGLVMGDSHIDHIDPTVVSATFTDHNSICQAMNPERLVWHDMLDSHSISHHNERDPVLKVAKALRNQNSIEAEIARALGFIDTHTPHYARNVIPASNHNEHLARWVRDNAKDPARDPTNVIFWAHLFSESIKHETAGTYFDPLEYVARNQLGVYKKTKFLRRDEAFNVGGFGVDNHGDLGPNGARGSLMNLSKMGLDIVIGHGHGPGIEGQCIQVGTSSKMRLGYNRGPSSWLHTHFLIYPNGKGTLINIIDGEWRMHD